MINHSSTFSPRVLLIIKKKERKVGGHRPKPTKTRLTKTIIWQPNSITRKAISRTTRKLVPPDYPINKETCISQPVGTSVALPVNMRKPKAKISDVMEAILPFSLQLPRD
jgi:hypothetical protein